MKRLLGIVLTGLALVLAFWFISPQSFPPRVAVFLGDIFPDKSSPITADIQVITDKMVYKVGDAVVVTVNNPMDESILTNVGTLTPIFAIEYVERLMPDRTWRRLHAYCDYPHCTYTIETPVTLKPGGIRTFKWRPLIYLDGTAETFLAGPGLYRLIIRYQIRETLSDTKYEWRASRSNEFKFE